MTHRPRVAWRYLGGINYEAWIVDEKGVAAGQRHRSISPHAAAARALEAQGLPRETRHDLIEASRLDREIFGNFDARPTDL